MIAKTVVGFSAVDLTSGESNFNFFLVIDT